MRRGFTLIELLVVLAIIAVMVSIALASVTGGREAAHVRDASRAVLQMSRYASSLALLRQRPVVVTYRKHRVDVQISGDSVTEEDVGSPAAPIYMEVDGEEIDQTPLMLEDEEERDRSNDIRTGFECAFSIFLCHDAHSPSSSCAAALFAAACSAYSLTASVGSSSIATEVSLRCALST